MKPTLAKTYASQDPTGWLMSEKLDGVRAIWTGEKLISRNGNEFAAPQWFLDGLPSLPLDGELWMGRGKFQAVVGAVRRKTADDAEWREIRFMVFDAPTVSGDFLTRLSAAKSAISESTVAEIVPQTECANSSAMHAFFMAICRDGGEGVMLRDPDAGYIQGRTSKLLKLKMEDSEEAILSHIEHRNGRAVFMVERNGQTFGLGGGISESDLANPPAVGAVLTYKASGEYASGKPRCPVFVTERNYE